MRALLCAQTQVLVAASAVAATLLLAAVVYTTTGRASALLGSNNIYAETGMSAPPPAKPMVHHPHHPGLKAKAQTASEYEQKLGKDQKGNPLPKSAKKASAVHKSIWERMEDAYFHPLGGKKLNDKVRTKIYAHEGAKPAFKSKKGYKHWDKWENGYFQPLGKGAKVSEKDRLAKYGLEGGSLKKAGKHTNLASFRAKKAANWQKWEDAEFGHTQSQVAAVRLPMAPHKAKKARRFRLGGDTERWNKKPSHTDLINSIVDNSWVNKAEVDGSKAPPKPVRFVDTIA